MNAEDKPPEVIETVGGWPAHKVSKPLKGKRKPPPKVPLPKGRPKGAKARKNKKEDPATKLVRLQRRLEIVRLKLGGASLSAIGERLNLDRRHVEIELKKAIEDVKGELLGAAERLRILELMRLDAMQAAVWNSAIDQSIDLERRIAAQRQVIAIMERRARYLVLDSPARIEVTGADGGPVKTESNETARELLARFDAMDRALNAASRRVVKAEVIDVEPAK